MLPYEPCKEFKRYQAFGRLPNKTSTRTQVSDRRKEISPFSKFPRNEISTDKKGNNQILASSYGTQPILTEAHSLGHIAPV
jgi:hypothetical protein